MGKIIQNTAARARLTVGLLILGGLAIRAPGVLEFPFEQDELYTVIESTSLFESPLHPGIHARPVYPLLQHLLLRVTPASELSLRALPLLFGLMGIWVTWHLGRRAFGASAGLAAAGLLAISPWHIYVSGMARYWSLVYLLAALAMLLLIKAYQTDRTRDLLSALLVVLVGSATHPSFVFPMLGVAIGLSCKPTRGGIRWQWPSLQAWKWLWGPVGVLAILSFLLLLATGNESELRNWTGRGTEANLRLVPAIVQWIGPTVLIAAIIGALAMIGVRRSERQRKFAVVASLGVLATLTLMVAASTLTDVYADYAVAGLPLIMVNAGALLELGVGSRQPSKVISRLAIFLVIAAGILPSTVSYMADGSRLDYRQTFAYVRRIDPNALVLTSPIIIQRHYASALNAHELKMDTHSIDTELNIAQKLFIVVSRRRYGIVGDRSGEVESWIWQHCSMRFAHEKTRLDYRVYRVELYECGSTTAS